MIQVIPKRIWDQLPHGGGLWILRSEALIIIDGPSFYYVKSRYYSPDERFNLPLLNEHLAELLKGITDENL